MTVKKKVNPPVITKSDPRAVIIDLEEIITAEARSVTLDEDAAVLVLRLDDPLGRMVANLLRAWSGDAERSRNVIDALLPAEVPSAGATEQLRSNAEARRAFLAEFPALPAREISRMAGISWTNPAEWTSRLKKEGKVFAVDHGRKQLFPTFQFDSDWQPRASVAEVLNELSGAGLHGWSVALWWSAANGWLDGARPVDLLEQDPERVVASAAEVGRFPF